MTGEAVFHENLEGITNGSTDGQTDGPAGRRTDGRIDPLMDSVAKHHLLSHSQKSSIRSRKAA